MARQVEICRSQGNEHFRNKAFQQAHVAFAEALKLDPSDPVNWSNHAAACVKLALWEDVLHDSDRCLSLDPRHCKSFVRRAQARLHLGDVHAALEDAQRAKTLHPKPTDVAVLAAVEKQAMQQLHVQKHQEEKKEEAQPAIPADVQQENVLQHSEKEASPVAMVNGARCDTSATSSSQPSPISGSAVGPPFSVAGGGSVANVRASSTHAAAAAAGAGCVQPTQQTAEPSSPHLMDCAGSMGACSFTHENQNQIQTQCVNSEPNRDVYETNNAHARDGLLFPAPTPAPTPANIDALPLQTPGIIASTTAMAPTPLPSAMHIPSVSLDTMHSTADAMRPEGQHRPIENIEEDVSSDEELLQEEDGMEATIAQRLQAAAHIGSHNLHKFSSRGLAALERASLLAPTVAKWWYGKGFAYLARGEHLHAVRELSAALDLMGPAGGGLSPSSNMRRHGAAIAIGKQEEEACGLRDEKFLALKARAKAREAYGDAEGALQDYSAALKMASSDDEAEKCQRCRAKLVGIVAALRKASPVSASTISSCSTLRSGKSSTERHHPVHRYGDSVTLQEVTESSALEDMAQRGKEVAQVIEIGIAHANEAREREQLQRYIENKRWRRAREERNAAVRDRNRLRADWRAKKVQQKASQKDKSVLGGDEHRPHSNHHPCRDEKQLQDEGIVKARNRDGHLSVQSLLPKDAGYDDPERYEDVIRIDRVRVPVNYTPLPKPMASPIPVKTATNNGEHASSGNLLHVRSIQEATSAVGSSSSLSSVIGNKGAAERSCDVVDHGTASAVVDVDVVHGPVGLRNNRAEHAGDGGATSQSDGINVASATALEAASKAALMLGALHASDLEDSDIDGSDDGEGEFTAFKGNLSVHKNRTAFPSAMMMRRIILSDDSRSTSSDASSHDEYSTTGHDTSAMIDPMVSETQNVVHLTAGQGNTNDAYALTDDALGLQSLLAELGESWQDDFGPSTGIRKPLDDRDRGGDVVFLRDGTATEGVDVSMHDQLRQPADMSNVSQDTGASSAATSVEEKDAVDEKAARYEASKVHRENGNTFFKQGNFMEAVGSYLYAASLAADDDPLPYANLAAVYIKTENWNEAEVAATQALERDAGHLKARQRRAMAYLKQSRWQEASLDYEILASRGDVEAGKKARALQHRIKQRKDSVL